MKLIVELRNSVVGRARTWVSSSLDLGLGSPCAEVGRIVDLFAVVPLEVSVHSVEALELKKELVLCHCDVEMLSKERTSF